MWADRFDPDEGVVWVGVHVVGPFADRWLRFILDTGTTTTTVDTSVVDSLGYGAHMGTRRSRAVGIGGAEAGYLLPLARIEAMGLSLTGLEVACTDLPTGMGVDGLLGMDFLRGHLLILDCARGVLQVE